MTSGLRVGPTMFASLAHQRPLVAALVARAVKARYRGTALGFAWSLLNPVILMATYTAVFSIYLRVDVPAYPVFLFSALIPWLWFAGAMQEGTMSIVYGSALVTRSRFAPEVLPSVALLSNGVNCLLSLPLVVAVAAYAGRPLGWSLLALPVVVGTQAVLTLGLVAVLAAWNAYYRDIQFVVTNGLQILFFATPILYPLSLVPADLRWIVQLNPWAHFAAAYQDILYHGRAPDPATLALLVAVAGVVYAACELLFRRYREQLVEEL